MGGASSCASALCSSESFDGERTKLSHLIGVSFSGESRAVLKTSDENTFQKPFDW